MFLSFVRNMIYYVLQIEEADEEALLQMTDTVVACGYIGLINVDQKKAITEYVWHNI